MVVVLAIHGRGGDVLATRVGWHLKGLRALFWRSGTAALCDSVLVCSPKRKSQAQVQNDTQNNNINSNSNSISSNSLGLSASGY